MQTPRGFLIGAGVIAAIAALTSIGHPHTETAVEMTSPVFGDATKDTTMTGAPTTDTQTRVLAEHVEAGIDAGAAGASAAGAGAAGAGVSTTIELSNGDPAAVPGDAKSTPAAENRQDAATSTTVDTRAGDRSQPADPAVDSTPQAASPATTLAPTTAAAPATTPPPTTLAPTTTVPPITTTPSITRVTLPQIDVNVSPVTVPSYVVPEPVVVPGVPTPPK